MINCYHFAHMMSVSSVICGSSAVRSVSSCCSVFEVVSTIGGCSWFAMRGSDSTKLVWKSVISADLYSSSLSSTNEDISILSLGDNLTTWTSSCLHYCVTEACVAFSLAGAIDIMYKEVKVVGMSHSAEYTVASGTRSW